MKLVDVRRLEDMLEEEIQKLISSNKTRMGRGVQLEAKVLAPFVFKYNLVFITPFRIGTCRIHPNT